jgi:hypothetical protein
MLSSWSRRRAAVAAEAEIEERAADAAVEAAEKEALAEKTDEEILQELGLPDPDSLALGDDFKAFMSKAVPAHIRKRALRKLWRSNPVLACVDGLNDYDDDYLTQGLGQGAIKTTYQVGKGMLAHLLEMERIKDAKTNEVHAVAPVEDEVDEILPKVEVANVAVAAEPIEVDEESAPIAPRRMQFQFAGDSA